MKKNKYNEYICCGWYPHLHTQPPSDAIHLSVIQNWHNTKQATHCNPTTASKFVYFLMKMTMMITLCFVICIWLRVRLVLIALSSERDHSTISNDMCDFFFACFTAIHIQLSTQSSPKAQHSTQEHNGKANLKQCKHFYSSLPMWNGLETTNSSVSEWFRNRS